MSLTSSTTKEIAASVEPTRRRRAPEFVVLAGLVLLCFGVFGKTVFSGAPISKIGLAVSRDGVFRAEPLASPVYRDFDPCAYLFYLPIREFFRDSISKGVDPCWNPHRGCGSPELSNPSQALLNPFFLLSPLRHEYLYNLGLVLQSVIAGAGVLVLCRMLGCGMLGSFFAASAYGLSLRVVTGAELLLMDCLMPWIFVSTVVLSSNRSGFLTVACVAVCWALAFLSMHPEVFVIFLFCSLLSVGLSTLWRDGTKGTFRVGLGRFALNVATAGILSLGLTAPLLLPMVKHITASEFYKVGIAMQGRPTFGDLFSHSIGSFFDGVDPGKSLFCGVALIFALPAAFLGGVSRMLAAIVVMTFLSILWAYPPPGLADQLSKAPFSYLAPQYFLAASVCGISVLGALGLDRMLALRRMRSGIAVACLLLGWAAVVLGYAAFTVSPLSVALAKSGKVLFFPLISVLLLSATCLLPSAARCVAAVAVIVVNCGTLVNLDRQVVRVQPHITISLPASIELLRGKTERTLVSGTDYLIPNVASLLKINDVNVMDPLKPKRTSEFLKFLGATAPYGFGLFFPQFLQERVVLAGVRYVAARHPVVGVQEFNACAVHPSSRRFDSAALVPGLRLCGGWFHVDLDRQVMFGELKLRVHPLLRVYCVPHLEIALIDENGHVLEAAAAENKDESAGNFPITISRRFAIDLPASANEQRNDSFCIGVRVTNGDKGPPIESSSLFVGKDKSWSVVKTIGHPLAQDLTDKPSSGWLKLLARSQGGHRVYEVTRWLPQLYPVNQMIFSSGPDETLRRLSSGNFDPWRMAVIENPDGKGSRPPLTSNSAQTDSICLPRKTPSASDWRAEVRSKRGCMAVFLQTYFPGWRAEIDNKPARIYRANYMFQAIYVPAGRHLIRFSFTPPWSGVGLMLCSAALLSLAVGLLCWWHRRRCQPSRLDSGDAGLVSLSNGPS